MTKPACVFCLENWDQSRGCEATTASLLLVLRLVAISEVLAAYCLPLPVGTIFPGRFICQGWG